MAQQGRNTSAWKKIRKEILREAGYECAYCGDHASSVDHVVPLKHGGTDERSNLLACCSLCNSQKRDKSAAFFLSGRSTLLWPGRYLSPKDRYQEKRRDDSIPDVTIPMYESSPFKSV